MMAPETPSERDYAAFLTETLKSGTLTHAMLFRLCTLLNLDNGINAISVVDKIGGIDGIEGGPEGLRKIVHQRMHYLDPYIKNWGSNFDAMPARKKFFSLFVKALFEQNAAELLLFRAHSRDDPSKDTDLQVLLRPQTEAVRVRKPIEPNKKNELDLEINDLCRAMAIFITHGIRMNETLIPASFQRRDFLTMARKIVELSCETNSENHLFIKPPTSPDEIDALALGYGLKRHPHLYYIDANRTSGPFVHELRQFDRTIAEDIFYKAFILD